MKLVINDIFDVFKLTGDVGVDLLKEVEFLMEVGAERGDDLTE